MDITEEVKLGNFQGTVSLNNPVLRYPGNPILTCHEVNDAWSSNPRWQTYTAHNAGVAQVEGLGTVMLFRSHIADGRSVIGKAISDNGLGGWQVDPEPFLLPATEHDEFAEGVDCFAVITAEGGGVEDLRANPVGNGKYVLTYSAYHETIPNKVQVMMAVTYDFKKVIRHGPISDQDMRNVVIFPEATSNGQWAALVRLNDKTPETAGASHVGGLFEEVHIAYAPTSTGPWEVGGVVMRSGNGPSAFQNKIGPGAPPIKTNRGWLNIFHGVRSTMDGNPYSLGVAFHQLADLTDKSMSAKPILMPSTSDCKVKGDDYVHVPNVVFSCGALLHDDGTVAIYYGGNDTVMNIGLSHVNVLAALCEIFPQDPLMGTHLYDVGSSK